jgi:voltage-gated potassium channel
MGRVAGADRPARKSVLAPVERAMTFQWFSERRFSLLLLAEILVFIIHPLVYQIGRGLWLYDFFVSLVFLTAFFILFNRKGRRLLALVLGVPTVLANWTGYVLPGVPAEPLALTFHLFAVLFLGFTVVAILRTIHQSKTVTTDSLAGAFGGYLLAAVAFGHLFSALEIAAPGSYRVGTDEMRTELREGEHRRALLNYFSFMTLTTVGYGDVTPATHPARSLASLEAVVGQFYIAVLMAVLIGQRLAQMRDDKKSEPP